jgi:hypothetical protein
MDQNQPIINKLNDAREKNKDWRMSHLYKIVNKDAKVVQFRPNPAQAHYTINKHNRNIILKSRRLGFTTFSIIDMLDNTLYNRNYNSLFISYDDPSAKKVFDEMVKFAWDHYPFKDDFTIDMSNANMLKLGLGDNTFSRIEVKSTGRGGRSSQLHVSELGKISAKYPGKAKEIFTGTIPAVEGPITIESTAESDTGDFHDLFWQAQQLTEIPDYDFKPHEYKAHFYNWQWDTEDINRMVPKNSIPTQYKAIPKEFLDYQTKHNEKAKKSPKLYQPITEQQIVYWFYKYTTLNSRWPRLLQEYPTTMEDAFISSGQKLFDVMKIEEQKQYLVNPRQSGEWLIYEDPKPHHTYVLGADPSEGVGGDHSAICILDFTPIKPKVVAIYKDKYISPDLLAYEIKTYAQAYNYALAMVERNNTGHGTLTELKHIYPVEFIYTEKREVKEFTEETGRLGWLTTLTTKPRMFTHLKTAVNDSLIEIPSSLILHEMRSYDKSKLQQVKADPEATNHFDLLTALAIAFQGKTEIDDYGQEVKTINIHDPHPQPDDTPNFLRKDDPDKIVTTNLHHKNQFSQFDPFQGI